MGKELWAVRFSDGTWHCGYQHRSDNLSDAFLGSKEWAETIAANESTYGLDPKPVFIKLRESWNEGQGLDNTEHPEFPLTPLSLVCTVYRMESK